MMKERKTKKRENNTGVKVMELGRVEQKESKEGCFHQFRESSGKDDSSQILVGFTIASVHGRETSKKHSRFVLNFLHLLRLFSWACIGASTSRRAARN